MADLLPGRERHDFARRVLIVAGVALGVLVVAWLTFRLRSILTMVLVALFVAVAFEPPVHTLVKRGWSRRSATMVVFSAAFVVVVAFIWLLAPLFANQFDQLVRRVPELVVGVADFLETTLGFEFTDFDPAEVSRQISNALQSAGSTVIGGIIGLTSTVLGFLIFVTTVALFAYYMVAELPQLQRTVLSFMPERRQHKAMRIWDVAVEKMGGYVYSRLILAVLSGGIAATFLWLLDVPFFLSLGVWVGVLSQFVPVVGTYLASIFPALVALTFNDALTALWTVIFFVAYQQIENYLISPRVTTRTMEIHPAISVAAILIGANLMGGIGVILALPMAGIIQAILSETRKAYRVILDDDNRPRTVTEQ